MTESKEPSNRAKRPLPRPAPDYGLVAYPLSIGDQEAIKKELVANATMQVSAFPKLQNELLALLRRVYPVHLIAVMAQYGLSSAVSADGIAKQPLMTGIHQHHIELLQALALTLAEEEWGDARATPQDVEEGVKTVRDLADAFHARRFLDAQQVEEKSARYQLLLREKMRLHTQMIRNWGHFAQVVDMTRRLYGQLDAALVTAHGFSATNLIDVAQAMLRQHERRSNDRFQKLKRVFAEKTRRGAIRLHFSLFMAGEDPAPFLAAVDGWSLDDVRQRLIAQADIELAPMASYTAADIVAETSLPDAVVEAVLEALAFAPGALVTTDREHLFLGNPVWLKPAIRIGQHYFAPAPQSIFSFIHAIFRALATTKELKKALERRRACFLEQEVEALLTGALPGAHVQADVAWDLEGRRYQTDVVAKIDRIIVIAEAKSAALTDAALRGAPDRVRRHVGELIVDPAQQSLRLEALIWRASQDDVDAQMILAPFGPDFADADEVVRISVTLDDFSIIASSEPELRLAGWIPEDVPMGCTISIADLAAVVDVLNDPAQLVHYLAERQRIQKTLQILGDEMDFLGFYLESGFNIAAIERDKPRLSISGKSAEVDRWFMNRELGHATPRPQLALHSYFAKVIGAVRRHARPGWLTITLDLLRGFDRQEQEEVVRSLDELRREAILRRSETDRTATIIITPPANRRTAILFHVYPPEQTARRHEVSARLAATALETSGRDRCLMIGRDTSRWNDPYSYIGFAEA